MNLPVTCPRIRVPAQWQLRRRALPLGDRTLVMGVVNVTPDSFSDGGLYLDPQRAVEHAVRLLEDGADMLDLGAESTRPGVRVDSTGTAAAVTADEEQARLLPVLEALLRQCPDAVISVDTYKAATARSAVAAGAEMVNDVSGFLWDPAMVATCAELGCGVVLMHTWGRPDEWQLQSPLERGSVLPLVQEGLKASLAVALAAGILPEAIVLDPGYGFGKRLDENYELLAHQAELLELGRPLLAGLSRKSFLGRTVRERTGRESREAASLAALVAAILRGASIVRVHNVREAVEASAVADAILTAAERKEEV